MSIVNPEKLEGILATQKIQCIENINNLFNPSDYLVSPFNSTKKFMENQYFLTHQQEDVRAQMLKSLDTVKSANFISVVGSAGTGKTLLVYDLSKELIRTGKKIIIIHCGYLNDGQEELKSGSPRVDRRLIFLRGLDNEKKTWIFSRSTGTRSSVGVNH